MKVFTTIKAFSVWRDKISLARQIGFVPTMGDLHAGHLSLLERARRDCAVVVLSIFVNPAQFNQKADYLRYTQNLSADLAKLKNLKIDAVLAPKAAEFYPPNFQTWVEPGALTQGLCGPFRPGHFRGVATIVLQLLNLVRAHKAYFGLKDYQQLRVIEQMVQDFHVPTEIVSMPTLREPDGLAMSSRNQRLSPAARRRSAGIFAGLVILRRRIQLALEDRPTLLRKKFAQVLRLPPSDRIEYLEGVDPQTLAPQKKWRPPLLLAAAVWIEGTRLIDNILVGKK